MPDSWEADVVLRDGHTVRMRSIRPDDAGLITREQRGQWAWFRADEDRIRALGQVFA